MNPFFRPVGALPLHDKTTFVVWAPEQKQVALKILEPAVALHPMQADEWGYWSIELPDIQEGTTYLYQLEDGNEYPDPASRRQPRGVHGPSEVTVQNFSWNDESWKGLSLHELIIYELHTGTFTEEGNFQAMLAKLDYLKALGINAIELMPIAQFPGSRNWGYDGVFPFSIQNSYGTAQELKALVDAAHQRNIAVILDVVYNHMGPEGNNLKSFTPHYFTASYHTPWGEALNFDGAYSDGVRNFFIQNVLQWLDEFHFDGLRLDAVHAIYDQGAVHIMQEIKKAVQLAEQQTGKKKLLIAEFDLNNPRYIRSEEKGGYGLSGQWVDEFHHALHSVLTGETNGYYEDFGALTQLADAYRNTYVYNGVYSKHRKKIFGAPAENPFGQYIVFSQNHDHIGNRPLGDRLTTTLSLEALKLAAAAVLLSPYVPLLFMGEEYGEKNPFLFFAEYEDQNLGKQTSEGRRKEFAYFNFKDNFPDPLSDEVFQQSKLSWKYTESPGACLRDFYKHLIRFRKQHPAMQARGRDRQLVHPVQGNILAIERFTGPERLLMVMNFGKEKEIFFNQTQNIYRKILDSSDVEWSGPQSVIFGALNANQTVEVFPLSVSVFQTF